MSRNGTTLYVTGFSHGTRARDLAYEFERYGRLVRCDIPAPRSASSRLFAFVEYEDRRDADDAYHDMHNKRIGRDDILKIEWARTPPSASWRFDRNDRDRAPRRSSPRRRSPSPRRSSARDYSPRKDDRSDRRDRDRDYDRDRRDTRDRSRSPDRLVFPAPLPLLICANNLFSERDRDVKDERDRDDRDRRENGTNGEDRKRKINPGQYSTTHLLTSLSYLQPSTALSVLPTTISMLPSRSTKDMKKMTYGQVVRLLTAGAMVASFLRLVVN
ncbi:hypothetical protein QBC37DRAFT_283259 [Rhypophila decipiens]|uniref:RRM domain-containing protein n=1 Tax=Rhypophila decipiens TaxID=261697 RepID=A0AAN6Y921_9PEZI|nr:hypothetical protein QBC37DRAFT_283259 [Rhypophila decipiens]